MKITRAKYLGPGYNEMEIPVTQEQLDAWDAGGLIQKVMPNLTPGQREFIVTGILPDQWDALWLETQGTEKGEQL